MADFEPGLNYTTPSDPDVPEDQWLLGPNGLLSHLGIDATSSNPSKITDAGTGLLFTSNDGIVADFIIDVEVPGSFTLEFSGVIQQMGAGGFQTPSNRHLYFSAQNGQAHAGGLFLGPEGFTSAPSWGQAVAASGFPLVAGVDYTFRVVVNAATQQMHVYATPTAQAVTSGHVLRSTTALQQSVIPMDRLYIHVLGTTSAPTLFLLKTYRYAKAVIMPAQRPIAVPGLDRVVACHSVVRLDGTASYSVIGQPLTYAWSLKQQPAGAGAALSGTNPATWQLQGLVFTSKAVGALGNGQQVQLVAPGVDGPLSLTLVDGVIIATLARVAGSVTTTRKLLVDAFSNPYAATYNASIAVLVGVEIMAGQDPDTVLVAATGALVGGSDGAAGVVTFTPEVEGLYEVELVVDDGTLESLPISLVVRAEPYSQLLGEIPDAEYLWEYVSDFFARVRGKSFITTWWSALIQTIASQLLRLYQHDYAKSQASIQSTFVRRWLGYDLWWHFAVPKEVTPTTTTAYTVTPQDDGDADLTTSKVVGASVPSTGVVVVGPGGTTHTVRRAGAGVAFLSPELVAYTVVHQGNSAGYGVDDGLLPVTRTKKFSTAYGVLPAVQVPGDKVLIDGVLYGIVSLVDGVYTLDGWLSYPSSGLAWQVWRPVGQITLTQCPSLDMGEDDPLTERKFEPGDLLTLHLDGDEVLEEHCPVLAVEERTVWFDTSGLTEAFWVALETYEAKATHLRRTTHIPVEDGVVSIPRLQQRIRTPEPYYTENVEYTVEDGKLGLPTPFTDPPERLWAEVVIFNNDPTVEQNFGMLVGLPREAFTETGLDIEYLSAVRGLMFVLFRGPSVKNVRIASQIFCNLPFAEEAGTITLLEPNYDLEGQRGRVFIQSPDGRTRVYYYPASADLETNPSTGEPYALGDSVIRFAPLCTGVEVRDYLNSPLWWMGILPEIRKLHMFEVRIDMGITGTGNVQLLSEYVACLKPAWTDVQLTGARAIREEMPVSDALHCVKKIFLFDHPHTCVHNPPPPFKSGYTMRFDDYDGVGNWHPEEFADRPEMGVMCADPQISAFKHIEETTNGNLVNPANWTGPADVIAALSVGINEGRYPTWMDRAAFLNPEDDADIRSCFYVPEDPGGWADAPVSWKGPQEVLDSYDAGVPPPLVPEGFPTAHVFLLPRSDTIFSADALGNTGTDLDPPASWKGPIEVLKRIFNALPSFTQQFFTWSDFKLIPARDVTVPGPPWLPDPATPAYENTALCVVEPHDAPPSAHSGVIPNPLPVSVEILGMALNVYGYYFADGAIVSIAGQPLMTLWSSDKGLMVTLIGGLPSPADVVVRNPDGKQGVLVNGYAP